jgi:hypothetical protein
MFREEVPAIDHNLAGRVDLYLVQARLAELAQSSACNSNLPRDFRDNLVDILDLAGADKQVRRKSRVPASAI